MGGQESTSLGELFKELLLPVYSYGNASYIENISSGSLSEQKVFIDDIVPKLGNELEKEPRTLMKAVSSVETIIQSSNTFGLTPVIRIKEEKDSGKKSRNNYETLIQVEVGTVYGIAVFNVGKVRARRETVEKKIKERVKLFRDVNPPGWVLNVRGKKPKKRHIVYVIV